MKKIPKPNLTNTHPKCNYATTDKKKVVDRIKFEGTLIQTNRKFIIKKRKRKSNYFNRKKKKKKNLHTIQYIINTFPHTNAYKIKRIVQTHFIEQYRNRT